MRWTSRSSTSTREVRVARYGQADFARLIERIRQQKATGLTALYDAIGVYLDGAAGQDGRKVMLLYTDGGDTRSALSFGELIDLLKASDVTVYAIGELEHQSAAGADRGAADARQIAEHNRRPARSFRRFARELDEIYDKVVAEIRAQYTLGYLSSNEKTRRDLAESRSEDAAQGCARPLTPRLFRAGRAKSKSLARCARLTLPRHTDFCALPQLTPGAYGQSAGSLDPRRIRRRPLGASVSRDRSHLSHEL